MQQSGRYQTVVSEQELHQVIDTVGEMLNRLRHRNSQLFSEDRGSISNAFTNALHTINRTLDRSGVETPVYTGSPGRLEYQGTNLDPDPSPLANSPPFVVDDSSVWQLEVPDDTINDNFSSDRSDSHENHGYEVNPDAGLPYGGPLEPLLGVDMNQPMSPGSPRQATPSCSVSQAESSEVRSSHSIVRDDGQQETSRGKSTAPTFVISETPPKAPVSLPMRPSSIEPHSNRNQAEGTEPTNSVSQTATTRVHSPTDAVQASRQAADVEPSRGDSSKADDDAKDSPTVVPVISQRSRSRMTPISNHPTRRKRSCPSFTDGSEMGKSRRVIDDNGLQTPPPTKERPAATGKRRRFQERSSSPSHPSLGCCPAEMVSSSTAPEDQDQENPEMDQLAGDIADQYKETEQLDHLAGDIADQYKETEQLDHLAGDIADQYKETEQLDQLAGDIANQYKETEQLVPKWRRLIGVLGSDKEKTLAQLKSLAIAADDPEFSLDYEELRLDSSVSELLAISVRKLKGSRLQSRANKVRHLLAAALFARCVQDGADMRCVAEKEGKKYPWKHYNTLGGYVLLFTSTFGAGLVCLVLQYTEQWCDDNRRGLFPTQRDIQNANKKEIRLVIETIESLRGNQVRECSQAAEVYLNAIFCNFSTIIKPQLEGETGRKSAEP